MITNTQHELIHLFRQLIEKYGKDMIVKGAFSLILNTSELYPLIDNRFTGDIDFYLKQNFGDFLDSLTVSGICSLSGKTYVFTKQRTPKKNSGGRVKAVAGEVNVLLDVQIDDYLNPITVMTDNLLVKVTSPLSIVIDKLDAISKPKVVMRPKDLFDLYVISLLYEFRYKEIRNHPDFKIVGTFEEFIENWETISEAYYTEEILIGQDMPDFDNLYIRVKEFASPFIVERELVTKELEWSKSEGRWVSKEPPITLTASNIFAKRGAYKK